MSSSPDLVWQPSLLSISEVVDVDHSFSCLLRIELDPVVALVSLGEPRKFLLRPKGGGKSRAFLLGRGDLLVTGGKTQRTREHSVPKVARAGPRISLAYRHAMDPAAYEEKRVEEANGAPQHVSQESGKPSVRSRRSAIHRARL